MQTDSPRRQAIPPEDPRYARSGRITAKFGEIETGAHIAKLADADIARFWPATHVLTCVRPNVPIERGMIFDAQSHAWEVIHAADPVIARLIAEKGERAAARLEHQDKGKFLTLYCKEARGAADR